MAKHLIFFIHGMGKHSAGWSNDAWKAFGDAYSGYKELEDFPLDSRFKRVEVVYDDVFERYRERWKKDTSELLNLITTGDAGSAVVGMVADLGANLGKDSYFTTHLMDVVMYRYLSLVRTPVRTRVAMQISKALADAATEGLVTWSVVTHSLGTSVGHDTLHYMFASGESEIPTLSRKQFSPKVGLFVANVSRVLQSTVKVYASLIRPSWQRQTGIFDFYLNAHHVLDPFPRPKPFSPGYDWLDSATRSREFARFQDLSISEITDPNVHDLDHYLANPGVHIPFIRALFGQRTMIPAQVERRAVEAYREEAQKLPYNGIRDQLIGVIDREGPEIEGLLKAASTYESIMRVL